MTIKLKNKLHTHIPTQTGPFGIKYDFNKGARIHIPAGNPFVKVRLIEQDSEICIFDQNMGNHAIDVCSVRFYFLTYRLEVYESGKLIWKHIYDCCNREVLISLGTCGLGDSVAWVGQAIKFMEKHGCKLTVSLPKRFHALYRSSNPNVKFVDEKEYLAKKLQEKAYATYLIGLLFIGDKPGDDYTEYFVPCDFRRVGLCDLAAYILGLFPEEHRPIVTVKIGRPIADKYVCIGADATGVRKLWNNETGWTDVIKYLKAKGYRVICIDKEPKYLPEGAEDETGDRPLPERARWLAHADAFIGLSSGLSWIAWALGRPVVMISGFTHPLTEFKNPYRVINWGVCNSCWNSDGLWDIQYEVCPKLRGTPREFECSKYITASMAIEALNRALHERVAS